MSAAAGRGRGNTGCGNVGAAAVVASAIWGCRDAAIRADRPASLSPESGIGVAIREFREVGGVDFAC